MNFIKICFITREYAHPKMGKTGGIGVFVKQFTQELQQRGHNITIFSFGSTAMEFKDHGVQVVSIKDLSTINERIKSPFRRFKIPGYITLKRGLEFVNRRFISWKASKFVSKQGFDLVEFHDYGGDACYFKGQLPKVVRCHGSGLTLHQFMGYDNRLSDTIFERRFFKRIHTNVIAVSQHSADITQKSFNLPQRPTVLYNGVTMPVLPTRKNYLQEPTQPFSIFYFGSIRERKGIDIACRVFNKVLEHFPQATFHIMGNNNNDYWNQKAINLLSDKARLQTTYHGAVPNAEIESYLQKAHVVLFPSFGENFSVGLLEVMALGKVVITSNIPSFQEIIQHGVNGLLAQIEEDYEVLVTQLFLNKINAEQLSTEARKTIEQNFDWKLLIEKNIKYYQSLI
ncbi:glycosyltransferase family 4 protein [Mangrovimonas sp. YM274]|uniref:glycosyltransferase family 4 protein n=1 Tax=Mangrovimonas sp. YM274 TaxID=3070660 RepID=UPI0027DC17B5|nr:glycosyltransferase family 4 protein [Mangrovimonas sp. YM274]WMI69848.1 glycosyltransferase family 4 protein [Mangrovimonas sp. YM274]